MCLLERDHDMGLRPLDPVGRDLVRDIGPSSGEASAVELNENRQVSSTVLALAGFLHRRCGCPDADGQAILAHTRRPSHEFRDVGALDGRLDGDVLPTGRRHGRGVDKECEGVGRGGLVWLRRRPSQVVERRLRVWDPKELCDAGRVGVDSTLQAEAIV